jgi:YVTN family beta-propeller protein
VPAGLAWAPNGTDLLVTLSGNNTLGVIDTTTNSVHQALPGRLRGAAAQPGAGRERRLRYR